MTRPDELNDQLPVVPFCPFRCPRCTASKPFTYGQKGRIRYHRCQECGTRFRSLELRRDQLQTFDPPPRAPHSAPLKHGNA
jgi:tRNA(Ile2) C34 agmatinyltransferase TiaS